MQSLVVFAGPDIVSHLVLRRLVMFCRTHGLLLRVKFPTAHLEFSKHTHRVQEYLRLERTYLYEARKTELKRLRDNGYLTLQWDVDVNSPELHSQVRALDLFAAVNLRGYQKFRPQTIDVFWGLGTPLMNLHPGLLPDYRGLFSTFWVMRDHQPHIGCTLHEIDADYDTGPIIESARIHIDSNYSVLGNVLRLAGIAELLLVNEFQRRLNGRTRSNQMQREGGHYWSTPPKSDVQRIEQSGEVSLVNIDEDRQLIRRLVRECPEDQFRSIVPADEIPASPYAGAETASRSTMHRQKLRQSQLAESVRSSEEP